jgi:hypothetical protein
MESLKNEFSKLNINERTRYEPRYQMNNHYHEKTMNKNKYFNKAEAIG